MGSQAFKTVRESTPGGKSNDQSAKKHLHKNSIENSQAERSVSRTNKSGFMSSNQDNVNKSALICQGIKERSTIMTSKQELFSLKQSEKKDV